MSRAIRRANKARSRRAAKQGWGEWVRIRVQDQPHHVDPPTGTRETWSNHLYLVFLIPKDTAWGLVTHIMVRPWSEKAGRSWSHMQRIKEELVGDVLAVEVYPRRDDLIDHANIYHLWCLPSGMTLPFGLEG